MTPMPPAARRFCDRFHTTAPIANAPMAFIAGRGATASSESRNETSRGSTSEPRLGDGPPKMAEPSSQSAVGTERPRFNRVDRHTKSGADLRLRQGLEMLEPDDFPLDGRQLVYRLAHRPHVEKLVHAIR
jgi:hypothetical protein